MGFFWVVDSSAGVGMVTSKLVDT